MPPGSFGMMIGPDGQAKLTAKADGDGTIWRPAVQHDRGVRVIDRQVYRSV